MREEYDLKTLKVKRRGVLPGLKGQSPESSQLKKTNNPWLDKFGWFKNDPTFDDLQREIAAYRQEIDRGGN